MADKQRRLAGNAELRQYIEEAFQQALAEHSTTLSSKLEQQVIDEVGSL